MEIRIYCYINSAAIWGIRPYVVKIEADISQGIPQFNMVGLLSSEVREARERVRTALKNMGQQLPYGRITINLSPADRKKEGVAFDLAIAVSLLVSMKVIRQDKIKDFLIIGELGLNGDIKAVKGILPIIIMAKQQGFKYCMIPFDNKAEGEVINDIIVVPVKNLQEVKEYFNQHTKISLFDSKVLLEDITSNINDLKDFSDINGHEYSKRAVTVAAAGRHNILFIGSPGSGKTMIASRIPGIMPDMTMEERIEISSIHSVCGLLNEKGLIRQRPFRAPHHSITLAALIGGGIYPKPGEITLAHGGVLFLDELPEFQPRVLDALRQPIEEKEIRIVRNGGNYQFPSDCMFVAAMNPCRCGFYPDRNKCNCSIIDVKNYLGKISGAFQDRLDMCIEVSRQSLEEVKQKQKSSKSIKEEINKAIAIQKNRNNGKLNSQLTTSDIKKYCILETSCSHFMQEAYGKFSLSMRGYYKVIKVARTIADLENSTNIKIHHLAEALGYRNSSGKYWN